LPFDRRVLEITILTCIVVRESSGSSLMEPDANAVVAAVLDDLGTALSVDAAQACGLLDQLAAGPTPRDQLRLPKAQSNEMLALLLRAQLVTWVGDDLVAAAAFQQVLQTERRDLLARLEFGLNAAEDMIANRNAFFSSRSEFMERAHSFRTFCYHRARKAGPANLLDCTPWVAHVSGLSRAESGPLAAEMALSGAEQVLEIGGNTGVFALEMLARWPKLDWTVLDLPAVCALGRKWMVDPAPLGLRFHAADARDGPWPLREGKSPELVVFKSVLHDWDDRSVDEMLAKAASSLRDGGRVLIVERSQITANGLTGNMAAAANLVFAGFYRPAEWYVQAMERAGLTSISLKQVQIDMPFNILSGSRG
jgi:SAM-dependent methyltransferase